MIIKQFFKSIALAALLGTGITTAGIAQDSTDIVDSETNAPVILSTNPTDGEMNVDQKSSIEITFDSEMDETTIDGNSLLFHTATDDSMHNKRDEMMDNQMKDGSGINDTEDYWQDAEAAVNGTISYSNKVAVFTPDTDLKDDTKYTFTVTHRVKNLENVPLENDYTWSFRTAGSSDSTYMDTQNDNYGTDRTEHSEDSSDNKTDTMQYGEKNMIDLSKAGQYVILAKKSVVINSASRIKGLIGEGSVATSINNEVNDSYNDAYSVRQATLARNATLQTNQNDTSSSDVYKAIEDMVAAYSEASKQNGDDSISGRSESFHDTALTSGIYEWNNSLNIDSDVTLSGSADDVWVFKIGDNLTVNENIVFTLTDGAQAENVFWVVEGGVAIGENANFEGIILSMKDIILENGAKLNGRIFSQALITLDDNIITEPRSMAGHRTSTNR